MNTFPEDFREVLGPMSGPHWELAVARMVSLPITSGVDFSGTDWSAETLRDDLWEASQRRM